MVGTAPSAGDCARYYKLEEASGVLVDTVGNGNATNHGCAYEATGILDSGIEMDGLNDYVSLSQVSGAKAISYWIKTSSSSDINQYCNCNLGSDSLNNGEFYSIIVRQNHATVSIRNTLLCVFVGGTILYSDSAINDGNWHHIVHTISGTTHYLYVDGTLNDSAAIGAAYDFGTAAGDITIGKIYPASTGFLGIIDEFSIFTANLTADNVTYLYNGGSPTSAQQYPFPVDDITLLTPDGSESLTEDDVYEITWSSIGTVGAVHIEYSVDDGSNYSDVVASTTNDGSYDWTVPAEDSAVCLVRVGDGIVSDVSDANFTIARLPTPPAASNDGGHLGSHVVKSWLSPVVSWFDRGYGFVEQSNKMLMEYVSSPHLQIAGDFSATVVKVHDGDTVTLRTGFRDFDFPLRLANIDADELSEGGESARDYLSSRVLGKDVLVVVNSDNRVGKYGRLVGELFVNGFNVGADMVRRGIVSPFGKKNEGSLVPFSKILARAGY